MPTDQRAALREIRTFPSLVRYLRDEMGWPIGTDDFEELTFEYTPEELGIDTKNAAKIQEIKRLRPLATGQPWGIFFVKFEPRRLPVVALRRILSQVALKKRASANPAERTAWAADDLLFVSNYGEGDSRQISFAHFSKVQASGDLPTLKVLGWDNLDTPLRLDDVAKELTQHLAWPDDEDDVEAWRTTWRAAFTLRHREVITTSKKLSIELAKLARAIRDRIKTALTIETKSGPLTKLMKAFQEALVHDLDPAGFADMYAQTIAYGLLSARIADPEKKTADDFAAHMRTNPFLKELMEMFLHVGGRRDKAGGPGIDFDELGISEVIELLDDANMEAVVRDFGDRNPQEDPVIHFYEHFLAAYDKKQKVKRGVFYTPRPVVSYIVRSVDELLRTEFDLEAGLADTTTWGEMAKRREGLEIPEGVSPDQAFVQILDPATGTGTFLVEVIDLIHKAMVKKWKAKGHSEEKIQALWNDYVPTDLLPRLHGYELLMAPYAIAHLKIGLKLHETRYRFGSDERARVYLTNALEPERDSTGQFEYALPALAHEAQAVNDIKNSQRFTVVVGNPPYSVSSSNVNDWIVTLLEEYKRTVRSEESQIQAISDDYVKFLRFAHEQTVSSGFGIVAMITNNGFLGGPLFRDLRMSWLSTFKQIQIANLHGSTRWKEKTPDGGIDENVFDIQQGVAVSVLVRGIRVTAGASVSYVDFWGERGEKYDALLRQSSSVGGLLIFPQPPLAAFVITSAERLDEYEAGWSILELFGTGEAKRDQNVRWGTGFATRHDRFAISTTAEEVMANVAFVADTRNTWDELNERFRLCTTKHWNPQEARTRLARTNIADHVRRVQYRPFDYRYTVYLRDVVLEPRTKFMRLLMDQESRSNMALVTARIINGEVPGHDFVSRYPVEKILLSAKTSNNAFVFPLYVFEDDDLLGKEVVPNIAGTFVRRLGQATRLKWLSKGRGDLNESVGPESVLFLVYAELHSRSYRAAYSEYLKTDFPRVFLPRSLELFRALARLGGELVALHLMESPRLEDLITNYVGPRKPEIGRVGWLDGTVWLDAGKVNARERHRGTKPGTCGFEGVPEEVWDFHIGGYQVCHKWLKDRKGRTLSNDDLAHYQKIVVAVDETIRIMQEIDDVIDQHGGWPGAFHDTSSLSEEHASMVAESPEE